MSDEHLFEGQSPIIRLRVWALGQMVWGAFMGGIFAIALGVIFLVVWGIGQMLPPESKEAPSPYGALEIVQPLQTEVV